MFQKQNMGAQFITLIGVYCVWVLRLVFAQLVLVLQGREP